MKLATLKNSKNPDGDLLVVSRDHRRAAKATSIAPSLREAVERWEVTEPALRQIYNELNGGRAGFDLDQNDLHSPLPRSFAWLDGSAYIQHVKLVRRARNAPLPEGLETDPLMYQGGSDSFLAPRQDIPLIDPDHGLDFEGEIAVITGNVPMGVKPEDAQAHVRLLMLVNDVSLRGLIPPELKKGFGFLNSKPSTAFSPFALTPDELGGFWRAGRVHLPLKVTYNGSFYGIAEAGQMHFSFYELMAHAAKTRELRAGTILGSGTVSNEDTSKGSSCLAEKRMLEKIETGAFITPFMKENDVIRIEMQDPDGNDLFGVIEQKVVRVNL